ncbi:MAG TPA: M23 family metallopeptidase [Myxococcales bacterium]|nr:M23 family metallopeptidase [Myxococcales bacterium]
MPLRDPIHLGGPARRRRPLRTFLFLALVAAAASGWVRGPALRAKLAPYLARLHLLAPAADVPLPPAPPAAAEATATAASPAAPEPALAPQAPRAPSPADRLAQAGLEQVSVRIDGPLESALDAALGKPLGPQLAQVVTRALVWWVDVPGDLRRGDRLDILFQRRGEEEPALHAIRFRSGKLEKTLRAYRFQAAGDPHPRLVVPTGEELELRLQDAPLDDYEQITSLIKDGRHHQGVDFKTPFGSPVKATFAGVVTRKNWNWRANGNCLELSESSGPRRALFLHLDELPRALRVGQRVERGEVVARSGNSGHSFAPHLHYQLMRGEAAVLDPFAEGPTSRRQVPPAQKAVLEAEVLRLDGLMDSVPAPN